MFAFDHLEDRTEADALSRHIGMFLQVGQFCSVASL